MKGIADFFLYRSYHVAFFFLYSVLPPAVLSVYISIYLLFPFLQKKRYAIFITGLVGLIIFNCVSALFFYSVMRPYICPDCNAPDLLEKINTICDNGINIASFLALVALGIKFTKNWYHQQIQNRVLARQKITSELKLLKARIQPRFLFETLQVLYYKISSDKNVAAEILLKFSELLSYMLYECNDEFVSLQRELFIINEFIELEKMMNENKIKLTNDITNHVNKKYIPSFILLSLIQNCIIAIHDNTHKVLHHIHVKILAENNILYCMINIDPADADATTDKFVAIIDQFINRLETFYMNNYKLEISEVKESNFTITMSILLLDNFSPDKIEEISETAYANAHI